MLNGMSVMTAKIVRVFTKGYLLGFWNVLAICRPRESGVYHWVTYREL